MRFEDYSSTVVSIVNPTILGLTLKPLSLGHYFHMKSCGCNFAADEDETQVDMIDLIIGCLVCSMTFEQFEDFKNDEKRFFKEINKWGQHVNKAVKKDKQFNIFAKIARFKKYVVEGTKFPHVEPVTRDGMPINNKHSLAHWSLHLHTVLKSKINLTTSEVMNMPLTQAFSLYFQYLELEGVVKFTEKPEDQYNAYVEEINKLKKQMEEKQVA